MFVKNVKESNKSRFDRYQDRKPLMSLFGLSNNINNNKISYSRSNGCGGRCYNNCYDDCSGGCYAVCEECKW